MKKKDLTIVMVANNQEIFNDFLIGLNQQINVNYQLITIDNYENQISSATHAFNSEVSNAMSDLICFMHPDIRFLNSNSLYDLLMHINELHNFGVIGVAGADKGKNENRIIYSNILHGKERNNAGISINNSVKVQTVDECMFFIKKDLLLKYPFIERNSWHLYSVEYCLNSIQRGFDNFVIPAKIWHLSDGKSLDYRYVVLLKKIIKVYKSEFNVIYTTVKKWKTNIYTQYIYLNYYLIKQLIKSILF